MKKICFVDFDGVLTRACEGGGSYLANPPEKYGPDSRCVANLLVLLVMAGAKTVISSNWRKFGEDEGWRVPYGQFKGKVFMNPLSKLRHMLGANMIEGQLPPLKHMSKADVLVHWLRSQKEVPEFVVFDDDLREGFQKADEFGIKDRFIHTDPNDGLTAYNVQQALRILQ